MVALVVEESYKHFFLKEPLCPIFLSKMKKIVLQTSLADKQASNENGE